MSSITEVYNIICIFSSFIFFPYNPYMRMSNFLHHLQNYPKQHFFCSRWQKLLIYLIFLKKHSQLIVVTITLVYWGLNLSLFVFTCIYIKNKLPKVIQIMFQVSDSNPPLLVSPTVGATSILIHNSQKALGRLHWLCLHLPCGHIIFVLMLCS